jgi:4-hydroxybenzoate polyprenyltransferase
MTARRAYLELLRPPNLATAAADVLAGFSVGRLANLPALPWLLTATVCLYAGGVVLNDFFDRDVDRVERPERPIPSGRVSERRAAVLGGVLLAAGVALAARATRAAFLVALATAGCILVYDAWGKRTPIGPVNMGACRALNLGLGMTAAPGTLAGHWWLTLLPLAYISAVTAVSRGEVHGGSRRVAGLALISLTIVAGALAALPLVAGGRSVAGFVLALLLARRVLPPFWRTWQQPAPDTIRRAVRTGVLSLVLVDAVIGATYGGPFYWIAILATALAAGWLARLFAVT